MVAVMSDAAWVLLAVGAFVLVFAAGLVVWLVRVPAVSPEPVRSQELEALVEINRLLLDVVGRMVAPVQPAVQVDPYALVAQEAALDMMVDPSPDPALFGPLVEFDPLMNPHPGFHVEADL
jgi:hypothetical protein